MRTWAISPAAFVCGCCAEIVSTGAPVLRLFVTGRDGKPLVKLRCAKCAGESTPTDLSVQSPPREKPQLTMFDDDGIERPVPSSSSATSVRRQAAKFDWKTAQSGGE